MTYEEYKQKQEEPSITYSVEEIVEPIIPTELQPCINNCKECSNFPICVLDNRILHATQLEMEKLTKVVDNLEVKIDDLIGRLETLLNHK